MSQKLAGWHCRLPLFFPLLTLTCSSLAQQPKPVAPPFEPMLQIGHRREIEYFAFSANGKRFATGGSDWSVRVWDLQTGRLLLSQPVDGSWRARVALSNDGRTLAAFLRGGKASLFDVATGKYLRTLIHGGEPGGIVFSPDNRTLGLGSWDGAGSLWNYRTGKLLHKFRTHADNVEELAFSRNGALIATAPGERSIGKGIVEVFDVNTGKLRHSFDPGGVATSLAFSPDGRTLVVGTGSWIGRPGPSVTLWDLSSLKRVRELRGHKFEVVSIAFSADGRALTTGDRQGIVRVWNLVDGQTLRNMGEAEFVVPSVVSPNGRMAAMRGPAGGAKVYDTTTGKVIRTIPGRTRRQERIAFHPDGHSLLAAGAHSILGTGGSRSAIEQGEIVVWDLRTASVRGALRGLAQPIREISLSKDGTRITAHDGSLAAVWDYRTGRLLATLGEAGRSLNDAAISPDGKIVAMCGDRKMTEQEKAAQKPSANDRREPPRDTVSFIQMWSVETGKKTAELSGDEAYAVRLAFAPDGRALFATSGGVKQYPLSLSGPLQKLTLPRDAHAGSSYALSVSRDGRAVATAGDGTEAVVWRLADPTRPRVFPTPSYNTFSVQLSPTGTRLAIAGGLGEVKVWDTATGKAAATLRASKWTMEWVDFSPDGNRLAALDTDDRIRVWDTRSRNLLATLTLLPSSAGSAEPGWIAYTPSGDLEGSPGAENSIVRRADDRKAGPPVRRANAVANRLSGTVTRAMRDAARAQQKAFLATATPAPPAPQPPKAPEKTQPELKPLDAELRDALQTKDVFTDKSVAKTALERVRGLIKQGADPNLAVRYGLTPLSFASTLGDEEIVKDLLARGADINRTDVYNQTALTRAASAGHDRIIEILLEKGAELKGPDGRSLIALRGDRGALGAALVESLSEGMPGNRFQSVQTAYVLLRMGADANLRAKDGSTPLILAAAKLWSSASPLLKLLLERGADAKAVNDRGETALMPLMGTDNVNAVDMLLDRGADPNGSKRGWAPLVIAASNGKLPLVKLLLDRGADPNLPVSEPSGGRTALQMAVYEGHLEVARLLLDRGAKVNQASDYDHWTALTYAVGRLDRTAVQLLIDRGADVQVKTKEGKSLLQVLRDADPNDTFEIAAVLKKAGLTR